MFKNVYNVILFLFVLNFIPIETQVIKTLSTESNLLELKDYLNMGLFITNDKLFSNLADENPTVLFDNQNFPSNSVFATYDSDYLLIGCSTTNFLGSININTGEEKTLYLYSTVFSGLTSAKDFCSISYLNPYVFVVHTEWQGKGNQIILRMVKTQLTSSSSGPTLGGAPTKIQFSIRCYTDRDFKYISCEVINIINSNTDYGLVCGYIKKETTLYLYTLASMNTSFSGFGSELTLYTSESLINFDLQRINNTYIRYLIGSNSYEIYLTKETNYVVNIVSEDLRNSNLYSFYSSSNLFYYRNEYIFHSTSTDSTNYILYISNKESNNNLITTINNKTITKISGIYDESEETLIYVYQYSNTIEYFIIPPLCFKNAWHIDENNEIVCYDNKNYCQSNLYVYHTDNRQCNLSNCKDGYYKFNFECYRSSCPENTHTVSTGVCESNLNYCYIDNYYKTHCDSNPYDDYTLRYKDTKIYFNDCTRSQYFYNVSTYLYQNVCYEECPIQTEANGDLNICECKYYKFYTNTEKTSYECLQEGETCEDTGKYDIESSRECVNTKEECIQDNYKIFNNLCLISCPENTKPEGDYCQCENKYYISNGKLNCFSADKTCEDIHYPLESNSNECFLSQEDCITKGNKFFNNMCYISSCPSNSNDDDNDGNCLCSYNYYFNSDTDLYECLGQTESCESKGYLYKDLNGNECFNSLDDCVEKGKKIFNKQCYTECPSNTKIKDDDNTKCICENYFFYNENDDTYDCFDNSINDCMEANDEYKYSNTEVKECFKTKNDCLQKYENDKCTYYEECDPSEDFIFNNICYKDGCPSHTVIETENPKNCICDENYEFDSSAGICISQPIEEEEETYNEEEENEEIYNEKIAENIETNIEIEEIIETSIEGEKNDMIYSIPKTEGRVIPEEHYSNKNNCPYIYKGNCVLRCGENTCLNPDLKELIECIDITEDMKVHNNICIKNVKEMVNKFINNNNTEIEKPIETPSGTIIYGYPVDSPKENLIEEYPNITFVNLGECEYKIKADYNLLNDTKLYILGIDSPNLYHNSSINAFSYEIYLRNGTQLKDLSACDESKITTSSKINNLGVIKFEKAKQFSGDGYDIYNKSNKFYVDNCAPANDNGNDITLEDRVTYYYPEINICNEGCDYDSIDFETERFICKCSVILDKNITIKNNKDKNNEEDETYLDYFLSLINYKIFKCYDLLMNFDNYYYNGGFYIGSFTFATSLILIFVFCFKTINNIKINLFRNMPTKDKLKEAIRESKKNTTNNIIKNNDIDTIKDNPPKNEGGKKNPKFNLNFYFLADKNQKKNKNGNMIDKIEKKEIKKNSKKTKVIKENKKKSNQFHKRNNRIISNAQNITNRKSSKDKSHSLLFLKTEKINVRKDSNLEQNNQKKPLLKNING